MIARILTTAAIAIIIGFGGGWLAQASQQPHCPTEDSCTIDYLNPDGKPDTGDEQWVIEEDTP